MVLLRFLFTSDTSCAYPMSVSSFLRLPLVLLRGDDILQLSSIRVVTAVSCGMWSWLFIRKSLVYFSPFRIKIHFKLIGRYYALTREGTLWVVLCRQGDLLLVHYICFYWLVLRNCWFWLVQNSWFSIRFCGYGGSSDLACEQTLTWFLLGYFWMIHFFLQ